MNILVTGNKGYVGSHLIPKLKEFGHSVATFDSMGDLYDMIREVRPLVTDSEVVIHLGGISNNQTRDDSVYVYNTAFSLSLFSIPCASRILNFSSFTAEGVDGVRDVMSKYSKSKRLSEDSSLTVNRVRSIRPGVIWGKEESKLKYRRSLPYRLMMNELDKFFPNWFRNYIFVDDLIDFVCNNVEAESFEKLPSVFQLSDEVPIQSDWFLDQYELRFGKVDLPHIGQERVHTYPVNEPLEGRVPIFSPETSTQKRFELLLNDPIYEGWRFHFAGD